MPGTTRRWLLALSGLLGWIGTLPCVGALAPFQQGVWTNKNFFPIAVWLQSPARAEDYRKAGINTYVALWRGPTQQQLEILAKAGISVICHQNPAVLLSQNTNIIGWMHGDEPDNAQSVGDGKGWGPPVPPDKIVEGYQRMKSADPSRPILLNLGQGVAWDGWYGRGVRSRHPEDYPLYVQGCDIASFDIYPAVHDKPEVAGKLWYVAQGVERLVKWVGAERIVWNCIEASRISNPERKPTVHEIKAEVWMSLIHGSKGIIYFVHQFKPTFREASLLDDETLLKGVTALNRQISDLAPVLNSPPVSEVTAKCGDGGRVAVTARREGRSLYVFAVEMLGKPTTAAFDITSRDRFSKVQVLGENSNLVVKDGHFEDRFEPWSVRLYRLD